MGLSNEERYSKMTFACHNLYQLRTSFKDQYGFENLYDLLNKVWPSLLNNYSNNSLWFLGTDFEDERPNSENSAWTVALGSELYALNREVSGGIDLDGIELIEDDLRMIDFVYRSDAYDYEKLAKLAEVYQWTEAAFYGLRRYRDDFEAEFSKLNDVLSNIQGECFKHFTENDVFTKAFLARGCVMKLIHSDPKIREYCEKKYWHHAFSTSSRLDKEDLLYYHKVIHASGRRKYNEKTLPEITPDQKFQIMAILLMGSIGENDEKEFIEFAKSSGAKDIKSLGKILEQAREDRQERSNGDCSEATDSSFMYFVHSFHWDEPDDENRIPEALRKVAEEPDLIKVVPKKKKAVKKKTPIVAKKKKAPVKKETK